MGRARLKTTHVRRFKEDIQLAKTLGVNAFRFSFEWHRIEPVEGHIDTAAVARSAPATHRSGRCCSLCSRRLASPRLSREVLASVEHQHTRDFL